MSEIDIATLIKEHRVLLEYAINDVIADYRASEYRELDNPPAIKQKNRYLDYAKIQRLISAAQNEAIKLNTAIVIAICDGDGEFVMSYRMPGSTIDDIGAAGEKAAVASVLPIPQNEFSVAYRFADEYKSKVFETSRLNRLINGAYPIYIARELVGSIGISGGSIEQNNLIATKAVSSLDQGVKNEQY